MFDKFIIKFVANLVYIYIQFPQKNMTFHDREREREVYFHSDGVSTIKCKYKSSLVQEKLKISIIVIVQESLHEGN